MRDRNDTFLSEYGKLNSEYFANDCDGKPIYQNGVPVIKHGKTLDEYNNELARLADADAQITRNLPIKVNKATFNSELPPPEDILALDGLIEFEESNDARNNRRFWSGYYRNGYSAAQRAAMECTSSASHSPTNGRGI